MKQSSHPIQVGARLIDNWAVRLDRDRDRDPAEVVREFRRKVPQQLRVQHPLTEAEQRLWNRLADSRCMGVEVFRQVPVYLPGADLQRILTFFIPRFALCVEVSDFDFAGDLDEAIERMVRAGEADELLRDTVGIATLRVAEQHVLQETQAAVTMIRWELGLTDECGSTALDLPR